MSSDIAQDDHTALIIGLTLFLTVLALVLTCLGLSVYHFKKKTKQYHNFVNWYYKPLVEKKKVPSSKLIAQIY